MKPAAVYQPSTSLNRRLARRLAPMQGRRILRYKLTRPLVSFTFDDCPKSAVDNGLNKLEAEGWRGTVYISSGLLGTTNHHGLQMSGEDDYDGLRGITSGPMINQADLNQIRSTPLFTGQDFTKALAQINALKHAPAWITLFTHDITNAPTAWGCTPAQMDAAIATSPSRAFQMHETGR